MGIVGLSTNYYSDSSRVILFFATCLVILSVIVALIRWIGRLSKLGDVSEVIDLVEDTASQAFRDLAKALNFGGHLLQDEPEPFAIMHRGFGFCSGDQQREAERYRQEIRHQPSSPHPGGLLCQSGAGDLGDRQATE